MKVPAKSYWNSKGGYQHIADMLCDRIPAEGACTNPRTKNKALDKFRRACNCYYDLYNNGLINRHAEFRRMFPDVYMYKGTYGYEISETRLQTLEEEMDAIVFAAGIEQGLIIEV